PRAKVGHARRSLVLLGGGARRPRPPRRLPPLLGARARRPVRVRERRAVAGHEARARAPARVPRDLGGGRLPGPLQGDLAEVPAQGGDHEARLIRSPPRAGARRSPLPNTIARGAPLPCGSLSAAPRTPPHHRSGSAPARWASRARRAPRPAPS